MLTKTEKKRFRAIAHQLKPVVMVGGNGLSDSVIKEIDRALADHELIKIKFSIQDRVARKATVTSACETCRAELIQSIGTIATIHRASESPDPELSNILRTDLL
jgi:RNA-binding protein